VDWRKSSSAKFTVIKTDNSLKRLRQLTKNVGERIRFVVLNICNNGPLYLQRGVSFRPCLIRRFI
jgi:hypothetical protein